MGLKFKFQEVEGGDEPNVQVCYLGAVAGKNIIEFSGKVLEISNNFATNLMSILDSEQLIAKNKYGLFYGVGKFDDCHSFAFNLVTESTNLFQGPPDTKDFYKYGLEYMGTYEELFPKKQIKQLDLLTSGNGSINPHTFVNLGNINGEELYIHCKGYSGYVDDDGKWYFQYEINNIIDEIGGKLYIKEGLRKGGNLGINTIDEIIKSFHFPTINVYRRKFNV